MAQFQRDFLDWVNEKKLVTIATPNPEHMVQSADDDAFWQALQRFDVLLPDGVGLVLANRWWRWRGREHNLPTKMHRISGREAVEWWLRHLEQLPENQKHKTLLLGAGTGIAEQLARTVDETSNWCLGLEGYTKISDLFASQPSEKTQQEHAFVMDLIQQEKPKVVFVAFGAPHQERWIQTYRQELEKSGVKVAMVCGGAFDYLVGEAKMAPAWIASLGFEWLWRLILQPWRWRRQLRLVAFLRGILWG
ncbi:WecB/TagA/CpsF family glycosyltransferase [Candidatus Woesebacteria bacterium]|nr:WecB/TagA/CpsF family glycosyltransferase [Candidatus Woesebacteria bacterium]MCD8507279.1 WecB/TagA/CpsF family glycosyltransferase [Candidatus Woesebacteria bacterium]MCD8546729.1 WecB/TagA/CpsF family glycosyltransferase [Candidatus Woesebacteria bacterium]